MLGAYNRNLGFLQPLNFVLHAFVYTSHAESLRKTGATAAECRCVRTSSSVFKPNQTCFVESSLLMRHGFLNTTRKPNARLSCQWKSPTSPRPNLKARESKSKVNVMLITFFDVRRRVLATGPDNQSASLQRILRLLLRSVREKRRELWQAKSWLLHHDNAPAHNGPEHPAVHLAEKNIAVLEQPPCSHDLAPCDFFLFPKLKGIIKGTRFEVVEAIKRAVTTALMAIPEQSFQQCIA